MKPIEADVVHIDASEKDNLIKVVTYKKDVKVTIIHTKFDQIVLHGGVKMTSYTMKNWELAHFNPSIGKIIRNKADVEITYTKDDSGRSVYVLLDSKGRVNLSHDRESLIEEPKTGYFTALLRKMFNKNKGEKK